MATWGSAQFEDVPDGLKRGEVLDAVAKRLEKFGVKKKRPESEVYNCSHRVQNLAAMVPGRTDHTASALNLISPSDDDADAETTDLTVASKGVADSMENDETEVETTDDRDSPELNTTLTQKGGLPQEDVAHYDVPRQSAQAKDVSGKTTYTSVRAFKKRLQNYKKRGGENIQIVDPSGPMRNSRDVPDFTTPIVSNHEDSGGTVNRDSFEQLFPVNGQIAPPSSKSSTPPVTWNVDKCSSQQSYDSRVYHDELPYATWGRAQFTDVSGMLSGSVAMLVSKRLQEHGIRKDVPASMLSEKK